MADSTIHEKQAEQNRKLASQLVEGEFRDWSVTAAFYSALHYIETFFVKKNPKEGHTQDVYSKFKEEMRGEHEEESLHSYRDKLADKYLPKIRGKLRQLRTMSQAARYLENSRGKMGNDFIDVNSAKRALKDLEEIREEVNKT